MDNILVRTACTDDIPAIQIIRNLVKENTLSDPTLVSDADCEEYINVRGKGWVCELNGVIAGFSIVDFKENNVWALFVNPEFEGRGIGAMLHNTLLDCYFERKKLNIWLSTSKGTRADGFYKKFGWKPIGDYGRNETKFEMSYNVWIARTGT